MADNAAFYHDDIVVKWRKPNPWCPRGQRSNHGVNKHRAKRMQRKCLQRNYKSILDRIGRDPVWLLSLLREGHTMQSIQWYQHLADDKMELYLSFAERTIRFGSRFFPTTTQGTGSNTVPRYLATSYSSALRAIQTDFRTNPAIQDFPEDIPHADLSQLRVHPDQNIRREVDRYYARRDSLTPMSSSSSNDGSWTQWRPTLPPLRRPIPQETLSLCTADRLESVTVTYRNQSSTNYGATLNVTHHRHRPEALQAIEEDFERDDSWEDYRPSTQRAQDNRWWSNREWYNSYDRQWYSGDQREEADRHMAGCRYSWEQHQKRENDRDRWHNRSYQQDDSSDSDWSY